MSRQHGVLSLGVLVVLYAGAGPLIAQADDEAAVSMTCVQAELDAGRLADAEATLRARLAESPDDDDSRFALGAVQALRAVENLSQALYRHGFRDAWVVGFVLRYPQLPLPRNPDPQPIAYEDLRAIWQRWVDDLTVAEDTLAHIRSEQVVFRVCMGTVRLDLNGDAVATDSELLWWILDRMTGPMRLAGPRPDLIVSFDRADVEWLRGYCHLLSGIGEVVLAYDQREWFECAGNTVFPRIVTPHGFLNGEKPEFMDDIACIHLLNFPIREPSRMKAALWHFEHTLAHSRKMWNRILAESDDREEWIPSPTQHAALPGMVVTAEMITAWCEFLDEAEALLAGERLASFWRTPGERGINVRRLFTEPRRFDAVLWAQGTAATPYLEDGELTRPDVWKRLREVFGRQFRIFATWVN